MRTTAKIIQNVPARSVCWIPHFCKKRKRTPQGVRFFMEVPARFELANNGFADRGLTTWLRYHVKIRNASRSLFVWSG